MRRMLRTCASTVLRVTNSSSLMPRSVRPSAISARTSRSRVVSAVCICHQQVAELPVVERDVGELRPVRRERRLARIGDQQLPVGTVGRAGKDALRRVGEVPVVECQPVSTGDPCRVGGPVAWEGRAGRDDCVGGPIHPRHHEVVGMSPGNEVRNIASVRRPERAPIVLVNAESVDDPAASIRDYDRVLVCP